MPSYKTAFPSKFCKAEDLGASRPIGTIHTVDFETVGTGTNVEQKLVVHFVEPTIKPLVLNLINSDTIAEIAATDDYSAWPGCRIQLFAARTEFQGKRVPCIRLCAPPVADRGTPPSVPPQSAPSTKRGGRRAAPAVAVDEPDDPMPTAEDVF